MLGDGVGGTVVGGNGVGGSEVGSPFVTKENKVLLGICAITTEAINARAMAQATIKDLRIDPTLLPVWKEYASRSVK